MKRFDRNASSLPRRYKMPRFPLFHGDGPWRNGSRLPVLLEVIEGNEAVADFMGDPCAENGVGERRPDKVAVNMEFLSRGRKR